MIKVLLVEDDPMVAELNRVYVERVGGFETVASVRSGAEAMEVLRKHQVWTSSWLVRVEWIS